MPRRGDYKHRESKKPKKGANQFEINIGRMQIKGPYFLTLLLGDEFVTTVSILTE